MPVIFETAARLRAMSRRDKVEELIREILQPLVEVDGGGVELVGFEDDVVTLRISGSLLGDPGSGLVKRQVIEPAVRSAVGPDVEIVYERAPL